jgi:hypothetical protein
MGGGPTTRTETPRRIPAPASDGQHAGDGLAAPSGKSEPNFCELKQEIDFEAAGDVAPSPGLRVHLAPQHLPLVMAGGEPVGFVTEPDATAMRHCIEEGFRMAGSVRTFDSASRRGKLTISGTDVGG